MMMQANPIADGKKSGGQIFDEFITAITKLYCYYCTFVSLYGSIL